MRTTQEAIPSADVEAAAPATRDRDTELLVRRAARVLEEDIVLGYIHPRERLVEDDLRERFQLKRHVARQVLAELERMGLVERRKNVGALVKSFTVKEVVDLYGVREILETSCVMRIAFPVKAEHMEELVAIQRSHDAAVAAGDPRAAFHTNLAFHRKLFALSDNLALTSAIDDFAQRTHGIRSGSITHSPYLEEARSQHWDMIDALQKSDRERLVKLASMHLQRSRDLYIEREKQRMGMRDGAAS